MKCICLVFAALVFWSSISVAQDASQPLPFEARLVGALFNKQVQGELDLVDDQKQEMKQILELLRLKQQELSRELQEFKSSGASDSELMSRREEFIAGFEKDKQRTMADAMKVLLPHQRKRLRQAAVQVMMRESAKSQKVPTGVLAPEIRDYLEITDVQAERIKKKAAKLQQQLAEKIRKLTEQAHSELLSELTKQQQSKFEDLVGDPIQQ